MFGGVGERHHGGVTAVAASRDPDPVAGDKWLGPQPARGRSEVCHLPFPEVPVHQGGPLLPVVAAAPVVDTDGYDAPLGPVVRLQAEPAVAHHPGVRPAVDVEDDRVLPGRVEIDRQYPIRRKVKPVAGRDGEQLRFAQPYSSIDGFFASPSNLIVFPVPSRRVMVPGDWMVLTESMKYFPPGATCVRWVPSPAVSCSSPVPSSRTRIRWASHDRVGRAVKYTQPASSSTRLSS